LNPFVHEKNIIEGVAKDLGYRSNSHQVIYNEYTQIQRRILSDITAAETQMFLDA